MYRNNIALLFLQTDLNLRKFIVKFFQRWTNDQVTVSPTKTMAMEIIMQTNKHSPETHLKEMFNLLPLRKRYLKQQKTRLRLLRLSSKVSI